MPPVASGLTTSSPTPERRRPIETRALPGVRSSALFDNFMAKSKMQELVDKAHDANQHSKPNEAIEALIEAVKLLSRAQAQLMGDFEQAQRSRTDIPIGAS